MLVRTALQQFWDGKPQEWYQVFLESLVEESAFLLPHSELGMINKMAILIELAGAWAVCLNVSM